jgi:hypothetical protein
MLLIGLGLMLLAGGCGTVGKPPAEIGRAVHFVVVNLSDCGWQIAITPSDGGQARALHLAARETQEVDLSGGEYGIEQTAQTETTATKSTRRFTIRLEPGQSYRWRLVTLLSAPAGETRGDPVN